MESEFQGVIPMLDYEDANTAISWIEKAFGFKVQLRIPVSGNKVEHATLKTDFGVIILADAPSKHYHSQR